MRTEAVYQSKIIKKLETLFPGCHIVKNNPSETQGIPDILILFRTRWAALEFKRSNVAHKQVNQDFYVDKFNDMSFASFIWPENEEQVLSDLQQALSA